MSAIQARIRGARRAGASLLVAAGIGATVAAPPAFACNACVEDKIAATYDWEVVARAARARHAVVYTALQGPITPRDARLERDIVRRLQRVPGVDAGTVRVSLAPPAVSFACDPVRHAPPSVVAAMTRALADRRLSLAIVRADLPPDSEARAGGSVTPGSGVASGRRARTRRSHAPRIVTGDGVPRR